MLNKATIIQTQTTVMDSVMGTGKSQWVKGKATKTKDLEAPLESGENIHPFELTDVP